VDVAEGGSSLTPPEWIDHFRAASNELVTPKVLLCPRDSAKSAASEWSAIAGLDNVTYFAGVSAEEQQPLSLLAGDGNIIGLGGAFDLKFISADSIDAVWEKNVHVSKGNICLSDGSVQTTTTRALQELIAAALAAPGVTNVTISKPQGTL
jgi:hypothetical protein